MSAFGIALPVPTTTCSVRCGSQCSISRCQLSFSDAGQTTTAGNASSSSSNASASTVLPRPCSSAMNSRRDSQRVPHARALERPQLAAEPRPRTPACPRPARGERRTAPIAASCSDAQPQQRLARVGADVDPVQADEVLERLEQVRVDRQRAPVRLGRRQLDERADRVRVPVDLELEARLAVALDQHQRRRRRLQPDLQLRRAAQRPLVQPRARQLEQRLGRPPA